jgi:hypothetical protein
MNYTEAVKQALDKVADVAREWEIGDPPLSLGAALERLCALERARGEWCSWDAADAAALGVGTINRTFVDVMYRKARAALDAAIAAVEAAK